MNTNPKAKSSSSLPGKAQKSVPSTKTNTKKNSEPPRTKVSRVFKTGCIALSFLVIGFEAAIFISRASILAVMAHRDHPDTVYVYLPQVPEAPQTAQAPDTACGPKVAEPPQTLTVREERSRTLEAVREQTRRVESFSFDPNTVSLEDLRRLGFSQKQAQSIVNYRLKGGHFARKSDFAKSFVVSDSVFRRLEAYIDIPLLDINTADSAAFDALPGIGPYFASQMVKYREGLGGRYSCKEELLGIYKFTDERFDSIKDLITCAP